MKKSDNTSVIGFTNRVTIHLNMLHALMKHRIISDLNSTRIIGMMSTTTVPAQRTRVAEIALYKGKQNST